MTKTSNNLPATKGDLANLQANSTINVEQIYQTFEQINQKLLSICAEVAEINFKLDRFEKNFIEELGNIKSALLSAYEAHPPLW